MNGCVYEINYWWWTVFFVMICAGIFGGIARYHWEKINNKLVDKNGKPVNNWVSFAVMGVMASLLVPLFLNTISSTLIKETKNDHTRLFVLIGFCLAAAIFAKQFIGSVSKKALDIATEARETATKATETAARASETATKATETAAKATETAASADNRAIAMFEVLNLVDGNKFEDAVKEINRILKNDPSHEEAWAWKAYCLKRLRDYGGAVEAIEKALKISGQEILSWLYNLSCYRCLNHADITSIIEPLRRAASVGTSAQNAQLRIELQGEEDLTSIRKHESFIAFLDELPII